MFLLFVATVLAEQKNNFFCILRKCHDVLGSRCHAPDEEGIKEKQKTLLELYGCIKEHKVPFTEDMYSEIIKLISANLFRPHPCSGNPDLKQNTHVEDASRKDIELVYLVLVTFLGSKAFQLTIGKKFIKKNFLDQLLCLFKSESREERTCLVAVWGVIYDKFPRLHNYICKQINVTVQSFVYGKKQFHGFGDLLKVVISIIDKVSVSLTNNHKKLLFKGILPLHKVKYLPLYFDELVTCVVEFLKKDPDLTEPVVKQLLKFWSNRCFEKEEMFLQEIEAIFGVVKPTHCGKLQEPLFREIARCVCSSDPKVALLASQFWKEKYMMVSKKYNYPVLKIMFTAVNKRLLTHTDKILLSRVYSGLQKLKDTEEDLFYQLVNEGKEEKKDEAWKEILAELAAKNEVARMQAAGSRLSRMQAAGSRLSRMQAAGSRLSRRSDEPPVRKRSCTVCGLRFQFPWEVKRHAVTHSTSNPYSCDHCGKRFNRSDNLKRHLRFRDKNRRCRQELDYLCLQVAGSRLSRRSDEPPVRKRSCTVCGLRFQFPWEVKRHAVTHSTSNPYSCDQCGKRFNRSDHLKRHRIVHDKNRRCRQELDYLCLQVADGRLSRRSDEPPVRKHSCPVCGLRFNFPWEVKRHAVTHSTSNPYSCDHCGKRCNRFDNLKRHVRFCFKKQLRAH